MVPVLLSGPLLSAMDAFIVTVAIPALQADLGAGPAQVQLIIAGYALTYGAGMITGGRLGDLFGRRRMFTLAIALFTVMSMLCGLATSPGFLLVARVAQGAAAALMVPQVLAIFSALYDGEARAKAINWYGVVAGLGAVLGQAVSGLLITADLFGTGWRACFLMNVPVGVAAVVLALRFVPETHAPGRPRLDLVGMVLVTGALLAVVVPLTVGRDHGWPGWTWVCFVAAVPLFVAFGRRERRAESPVVDLGLFRLRAFSVGMACQLVFWTGQGAYYLVLGLYAQLGRGLDALASGLLFVVVNVGFLASALVARRLADLLGRDVLTLGAGLRIVALTAQLVFVARAGDGGDVGWLVPWLLLDGAGMGLIVAPLSTTVLARVPHAQVGSASGVLSTGVQVGVSLGVALVGLIFYGALDGGGYAQAFGRSLLYPIGVGLVLVLLVRFLPARKADDG
ncbi:MFS transporter [Actinophytocola xinjiangensis]|uniref:MFS transporter n=1 Tax=Actinophytocola xinjiangensis TaxID=485602 RepID=A0A7Z0WTF1_9PSEU|nr:MFS transporter [Actinophytocola xinjiangensis]